MDGPLRRWSDLLHPSSPFAPSLALDPGAFALRQGRPSPAGRPAPGNLGLLEGLHDIPVISAQIDDGPEMTSSTFVLTTRFCPARRRQNG